MKTEYVEVDILDGSQQHLYDDEDGPTFKSGCSKRIVLIVLAVVCVLALALGLGLGLGLNSGGGGGPDPPITEPTGCADFPASSRHRRERSSHRSKRWLTEGSTPVPGQAVCPDGFTEPPLLLISMDGFRAEYLTRGFTPTLRRLSEGGVHTPYMRASFPTKTFPNHYTLVTGLYPESHGIIDNTMYDLEWSEQFVRGTTSLDGKWWEGEPIWLTSKRQGKKSATMFWPGSESNITGEYPDYCYNYDESVDFDSRIEQVFTWLDMPADDRPQLITLYFHEPDSRGHTYGPFSTEINEELAEMDRLVDSLMNGITERQLDECINIIILADHGMGELFCGYGEKTVYMSDYLDVSQYYIYTGVHGRISSSYVQNEGDIEEVPNPEPPEETLAKLECAAYNNTKDWYLRFYHKSQLPKRLHYARHRRIDDIVIELEDKWQVQTDRDAGCDGYGNHGYDNTYKSMQALFMAFGPAFKQNFTIKPFENIEVYNLMSEILGLNPAPNNGTQGRLHHVLHESVQLLAPQAAALASYEECRFPDSDTDADVRRNATDCVCDDLQDITEKTVEELDEQLNLTDAEVNTTMSRHLPYGLPQLHLDNMRVCQLSQRDYIVGYSHTHHMPLWTAFTLNKWEGHSILDPGNTRSDKLVSNCVRADVRLGNQTDCSEYVDTQAGISHYFLYPPGFSNRTEDQLDGHISSNIVPMYQQFREGIWQELLFLVEEYAEKYGTVYVTTGPIFDYNSDGLADDISDIKMYVNNGIVPVPTHYFLTVTRCDTGDCVLTTELFSVILLHQPQLTNCWDKKAFSYIRENVARVRDVEVLTGLTFFTGVTNLPERALLQTNLEVGLWPRISWMDLERDAIPSEGAECPAGYNSEHPPVLMVSIDGFRNDYVLRNLTPAINRLRDLGVRTEHMRSVFPSMTFPNHYTQVTGLYPESHGIVDNSMYDEELGALFQLGDEESAKPEWWKGEPIWNTLELQNKTAMTMLWVGSDVKIQGMRPTRYIPYSSDIPYHLRVDTVLNWLNGSEGVIPDLVTLYFSSVDSAGHETGPLSLEVEEVMQVVDAYIQDLMDGLYRQKLHKCVNVMIMSDHGMSELSCDKVVITSDYLSEDTMESTYMYYGTSARISNEYYQYNSTVDIQPVPEEQRVPNENIVSNLSCVSANMGVFKKSDLPRRLHYMTSSRIDSVILKLNDLWQAQPYETWCGIKGQHGWDPQSDSMKAFFLAFGPAFESEVEVPPFENIELYNLLALLTNVSAAPNNGTEGSLHHLLAATPDLPATDPGVQYGECTYPVDDDEYLKRANLTTAGCSCDTEDIDEYNAQLDLTESESAEIRSYHLPHGLPSQLNAAPGEPSCLLHHTDYVAAFSSHLLMPLWSAFTLTKEQVEDDIPVTVPACLRPDVRLTQDNQSLCQDYSIQDTIQPHQLFPPAFASNASSVYDSLLMTNTVPMWSSFHTGIWHEVLSLIKLWAAQLETVHVVLGPVFDYEADGLVDTNLTVYMNNTDIPVPSHYYAIVLHCDSQDPTLCSDMDYSAKSFVVPHKPNITNCMSTDEFLSENLCRVRDIELLTGLHLVTAGAQRAIQTRTHIPRDLQWNVL